ncbi:MAG: DUF5715 family protein [bacterium]|nr:DUF5715 family protein [bacterium]
MGKFLLILLLFIPLTDIEGQARSRRKPRLSAQNALANREGLTRVNNLADIRKLAAQKILIPIPNNNPNFVVKGIPEARQYCLPWALELMSDLGKFIRSDFGKVPTLSSCVRDVNAQQALRKRQKGAAPASGPQATSHLTGATLDISTHGYSRKERAKITKALRKLRSIGAVMFLDEGNHWHVMVSKSYTQPLEPYEVLVATQTR